MPDNKKKIPSSKTTIQVSPGLLLAIKNEQNRLLNSGQGNISQGDLVYKAWDYYRSRNASQSQPSGAIEYVSETEELRLSQSQRETVSEVIELLTSQFGTGFEGYLRRQLETFRQMSGEITSALKAHGESASDQEEGTGESSQVRKSVKTKAG